MPNGMAGEFSSKAEKYARYRWGYAPAAIDAVIERSGLTAESTIAEIGSGTGLCAREFLDRVGRVHAVEPDREMRRIAERDLGRHPSFHSVDAVSHATTLPDRSVDLIVVAQALHWFDPGPSRTEFLRILRPGGGLAVLWNRGDDEDLGRAMLKLRTTENGFRADVASRQHEVRLEHYFGGASFETMRFPFSISESWEEFLCAHASASTAPDEGDPLFPNFERTARRIFDRFSRRGRLTVRAFTELHIGRPK